MIKYSIIIPTYKREIELIKCLELLYPQVLHNLDIETIVSADSEIPDQLIKSFNWVNFIYGPNKGPASNRNFAAGKAIGDWLLFLDDDCLPQPNWLSQAIKATSQGNEIYCIEGKTSAIGEKKYFDEVAPINETGGKLWSCNFGIRKKVFLSLNGFDEQYPIATMEDIDFKIRFEFIGKIKFVDEMLVLHPWRRKKAFHNFRKRLLSQKQFRIKHHKHSILKYRIQRINILISSIPNHLIQLIKYQGVGFSFFLDKTLLNFCMIFI